MVLKPGFEVHEPCTGEKCFLNPIPLLKYQQQQSGKARRQRLWYHFWSQWWLTLGAPGGLWKISCAHSPTLRFNWSTSRLVSKVPPGLRTTDIQNVSNPKRRLILCGLGAESKEGGGDETGVKSDLLWGSFRQVLLLKVEVRVWGEKSCKQTWCSEGERDGCFACFLILCGTEDAL